MRMDIFFKFKSNNQKYRTYMYMNDEMMMKNDEWTFFINININL